MYPLFPKAVGFLPASAIEPQALAQIRNLSELPIIFRHVAVMPDCHLGIGATIGSVIATRDAVIPAAVGVDIGCGMIAVRTPFPASRLPADLAAIRRGIEGRIPSSAGNYNHVITPGAAARIGLLEALAAADGVRPDHYDPKWRLQLGSLGGGNHFIEVCSDLRDDVWLVLHSGSRGVGNKIAQRHIAVAKRLMEQSGITLADSNLAYLPQNSPLFDPYLKALHWAQEFARHNRDEMMDRVLVEMSSHFKSDGTRLVDLDAERINCHHNFVQREHHFGEDVWVTRKGAIQARRGMKAVIPGSMGTHSYIVSGLEHPMAFHSAPHGAGRRFSRTEARRRFTLGDLREQMSGIEYRHEKGLLDEIPGAYKDIDQVMEYSRELVTIEHTLTQLINVKGN